MRAFTCAKYRTFIFTIVCELNMLLLVLRPRLAELTFGPGFGCIQLTVVGQMTSVWPASRQTDGTDDASMLAHDKAAPAC